MSATESSTTKHNFQDLHSLEGLHFIPVAKNKRPTIKAWQTSTEKHDLSKADGVGIVCGKLSGNLEVIDIDLKYDLKQGDLFEQYKHEINNAQKGLLNKLVVAKTRGGGYHFFYRCDTIQGNQKLAMRSTTKKEREETYKLTYDAEVA